MVSGPEGRDVLEGPYTARRGGGSTPAPPIDHPPLLPFQCLGLTAKILLRRLWRQEDLSFKNFGPKAGTIGGSKEEGCPSPPPPPLRPPPPLQTPPSPPPPPSNTSLPEGLPRGG